MTKQLTVVMCGLDEGQEVEHTMASVRATAGDAVDIVFVNDASTDDTDYAAVAERHDAIYVENASRRGCSRSRDIGVGHVRTPNAILIDSHMRFHQDNWWQRINGAIADDPRAIYCATCEALDVRGVPSTLGRSHAHGARIQFEGERFEDILEAKWLVQETVTDPIVDIPCVLGATYAFEIAYYQVLGGLLGLRGWGSDEPYLSLKAWLEGGRCRLLTDVTVGHKFKEAAGYPIYFAHLYYNKLLICETVLPPDVGAEIRARLSASAEAPDAFDRAAARIGEHADLLGRLRAYYAGIFTRSFAQVRAWNDAP